MQSQPFTQTPSPAAFNNNANQFPNEQSHEIYNPSQHQYQQQNHEQGNSRAEQGELNDRAGRDYTMFPVYSTRAALQFKLSETRKSSGKNFSFSTIMIEGAVRINPNDKSDRRYNWHSKLSIQIMMNELPIVISVLLGLTESCQYMNHGANKDKGFNFERQSDGLFASVFHRGGSMAVKIDWPTALNIGHFMLSQYAANFNGLSSDTILRNINQTCKHMVQANSFPYKSKKR